MSNLVESNTGYSDEWYTPAHIIKRVKRVLGDIDLDPASCAIANMTVGAKKIYTREEDGLVQPWSGRIFHNPPYSNVHAWVDKLVSSYRKSAYSANLVESAILLVNASIETDSFQSLYAFPICFPKQRIKFEGPKRAKSPPAASAIVYLGPDVMSFYHAFVTLGKVVVALQPHMTISRCYVCKTSSVGRLEQCPNCNATIGGYQYLG